MNSRCAFTIIFITFLSCIVVAQDETIVQVPPRDIGVETLPSRKEAQLKTTDQYKVFHDFQFADRIAESGITFRCNFVDDAGKFYKAVHYDHGAGIAVADVDGDGLTDIYFVSQLGENQLYKNLGEGKFKNITTPAIAMADSIHVTASFADFDNDGDADLFVTTVRKGNAFFENDGKGGFTDITKKSGLEYSGHSSGAVFFDYNNDGWLDLLLANVGKYTTDEIGKGGYYVGFTDAFTGQLKPERTEYSILYKNTGKKGFVDVSKETGLMDGGWSGDASVADLNRDGFQDLYILNMQGDDHFYENQKGVKFVEKTAEYFPKTPWGAMGIKFFDFNNDGLADLFITDMHSDMSQEVGPDQEKMKSDMKWPDDVLQGRENNIFGNAFYQNLGNGKFKECSDSLGLENYWPWGVSVDDFNADGLDDVFITASMNFPFRYGINSLLLNNNAEKFLDSEFLLGVEPRKDGATKTHWFDLDCAGVDQGHRMCGKQTAHFSVHGSLGSRASVIFDVDNDGDLDIVTNEFGSLPQILISNLAEKKKIHYVKVQLYGSKSNRNGLGAMVKVTAGNHTYTKWNDGKSGYLSQSNLPLYFGLGEAESIDRIEVVWPSGDSSKLEKPGTNTSIRIEEGKKN